MLNQQNSPGLRTPLATDDETTFRRAFSVSMVSSFSCLHARVSMHQGRTSPGRADHRSAFFACRLRPYSFVLGREGPMLYAIFCYDSEDIVGAWTKEQDDAAIAKLAVVKQKLAQAGRLGPTVRLMPTTTATTVRKGREPIVLDGPFAET